MYISFKDLLTVNVKYPQITVFEEAETFSMAVITNDPINNWYEANNKETEYIDAVIEDFHNWRLPTVNELKYIQKQIKEKSNEDEKLNYLKGELRNKFLWSADEIDDKYFWKVFFNNGKFDITDYSNEAVYPETKSLESKITLYVR